MRRIIRSFGHAIEGLAALVRTQPNFGVHLVLALIAIALAAFLRVSALEIALLALTIGSVLALEAFNTAFEALCDLVSPTYHPLVKTAKDTAAAGVLIAAVAAVIVGLAIFGPRILALLPR
jgi:diacylglycerol kinase (ATP)